MIKDVIVINHIDCRNDNILMSNKPGIPGLTIKKFKTIISKLEVYINYKY